MEQIVLDTNLKFVIKALNWEEKGRLLAALLEENCENLSKESAGIYQYILSLQQEKAAKNRKMRELSVLGVAARKRVKEAVTADLFTDGVPPVTDGVSAVANKRKEAKENNNKNKIKKIFSSSFSENQNEQREESVPPAAFVPPRADEVRAFVEQEGLKVHAETFVDFYDSHGWLVGKTPIKNWRATVRLWHRRYLQENPPDVNEPAAGEKKCVSPPALQHKSAQSDESYWHELNERVRQRENAAGTGKGCLTSGAAMQTAGKALQETAGKALQAEEKNRTLGIAESPFARFMQRIEDNDILPEGQHHEY